MLNIKKINPNRIQLKSFVSLVRMRLPEPGPTELHAIFLREHNGGRPDLQLFRQSTFGQSKADHLRAERVWKLQVRLIPHSISKAYTMLCIRQRVILSLSQKDLLVCRRKN